jgi:hypothetical protein
VTDTKAFEQIQNILNGQDEYNYIHSPKIVHNDAFEPSRFTEQESDIEGFETELIDQRAHGDTGDSFYGVMAYKLDNGFWFVLGYEC